MYRLLIESEDIRIPWWYTRKNYDVQYH